MSQFDFPRINFSGTATLDTPTANNGNYEPSLTLFDQDESEVFMPPRCYYPSSYTPPAGLPTAKDQKGNSYVPINPINADNYQGWASTPLGSFGADSAYYQLYSDLKISTKTPGYWNYYGDLSVTLQDVTVTGISLPDPKLGSVTFTPQNPSGCPSDLYPMLGAEVSFNSNYFDPHSRTTAYMCDVDSIGQMCTQIFCSQVGLYSTTGGKQTTFFSGTPCKSTARWMNLNRVLNYAGMVPMGGSASFYSTFPIDPNSSIAQILNRYTEHIATGLFMKILIHEVYEVRSPSYAGSAKKKIRTSTGEFIEVTTNPATVRISGSFTPAYNGEMQTTTLCRILKGTSSINISPAGIPLAVTKDGTTTIPLPPSVTMGPALFKYDWEKSCISIDLSNTINEYGTNPGPIPPGAGNSDIPPFTNFNSYDYGAFDFFYTPDGGSPQKLATLSTSYGYGMNQFLQTGGMFDVLVPVAVDYTKGSFMFSQNGNPMMTEDPIFITTDQQGMYAEESSSPVTEYMVDGLPRIPFTLRVLNRGLQTIEFSIPITFQAINLRAGTITNTNFYVGDYFNYTFPALTDGCMTYAFVSANGMLLKPDFSNLFDFASQSSMVVLRVLSAEPQLQPYLSGQQPITWPVVFNNVFQLYKALFPVMDLIVPLTEANWSEPFMQQKMLQLIDESNWNQPLYMPVTRDLSAAQRKLLQMWVQQSQQQQKV
jgi:hypothetical protein